MFTLSQYLFSLEDPAGLFRTLDTLEPERDADGRPCFTVGNAAVTFRVHIEGVSHALRCYFNPNPNLRRIYGEHYLERELYLYDNPPHGRWVDVVLTPWIEGEELGAVIRRAAEEQRKDLLAELSARFDRLAIELLEAPWAHGDLKPENILVAPNGELHLIDHDATFLPEMRGELSPELGTLSYQHPARTAEDFDASIDDFSIALIASSLYALSIDPTLYARYGMRDGLLIDTRNLATDEALEELLQLFARRGEVVRYAIARSLRRSRPATQLVNELFRLLNHRTPIEEEEPIESFFTWYGLWGYRTTTQEVIPPLYDFADDFREGVARVRIGSAWHYIDRTGQSLLHDPMWRDIESFRQGRARVTTDQGCYEIDLAGNRFEI